MTEPSAKSRPYKARGPGRPAGARPGAARESLLRAARNLMAEKGLPQVTAREVATRAELNPALVGYYFGGKDGLFQAVVQQISEEGRARTDEWAQSQGDARTRLRGVITSMIEGFFEDPYAPRLLFEHVLFGTDDVIDRFVDEFALSHVASLRSVLDDGQASGEFRELDIESTIAAIAGACVFYFLAAPVFERAFQHQPLTPTRVGRLIETVTTMVLQGIETHRERT